MGCDIYLHVEVKIGDKWEHYSSCDVCRSYNLFAKMANVRNREGIIPIDEPRGLPSDISKETSTHYESWGTDAHSASFLTAQEVVELEGWVKEQGYPNEFFRNLFESNRTSDFRFVFWFDN